MKISSSDILDILRRFQIADENNIARHIDQIKQSHPSPINQLVQFRFNRQLFFMLIDDTAEDRVSYILQQIYTTKSDARGELLRSPMADFATYGLPYKGKDIYLFRTVSDKRRLDIILAERHPDISRSTWQKYIKHGYVAVNDQTIRVPRHEISESDTIKLSIPDAADHSAKSLPIVYLDDHVIVVNKPAGILTHSKGALNDEFTVADFFRRYTSVGLDSSRPGVVHRLDRDTSGLIIGARTPEAFEMLKSQFANRTAKKTYLAITDGQPSPSAATIDIPIGRNPSAPSTFRPDPKGKPAQTIYHTLATNGKLSFLKLRPLTGRTHQLRVHLQYLRTPIHGDRVYGQPADRLYLHASELEITIWPNQRTTFAAPLPPEFGRLMPEVHSGKFDI